MRNRNGTKRGWQGRVSGTDDAILNKGKHLTDVENSQAIFLKLKGLSVRAIAAELDRSSTSVWRALAAYREHEKLKADVQALQEQIESLTMTKANLVYEVSHLEAARQNKEADLRQLDVAYQNKAGEIKELESRQEGFRSCMELMKLMEKIPQTVLARMLDNYAASLERSGTYVIVTAELRIKASQMRFSELDFKSFLAEYGLTP